MDYIDIAQDHETQEREALVRARKRFHLPQDISQGEYLHCIGCDAEIPLARRVAVPHVKTCVDCQAASERPESRR